MSVATIGAPATAIQSQQVGTSLGLDDFLKVLLTQLTYQDPLKPLDNQEFIAQMAQFTTLQETNQLNSKIDNLLSIQSAVQTVGLIGRTVQVSTANGGVVVGQVTTVNFPGGVPELTIKQASGVDMVGISLSQISLVR